MRVKKVHINSWSIHIKCIKSVYEDIGIELSREFIMKISRLIGPMFEICGIRHHGPQQCSHRTWSKFKSYGSTYILYSWKACNVYQRINTLSFSQDSPWWFCTKTSAKYNKLFHQHLQVYTILALNTTKISTDRTSLPGSPWPPWVIRYHFYNCRNSTMSNKVH